MSVNWYWKHKVGEIIYFDERAKKRWKLEMFGGNMMCAFIYRYKVKNEESGKIERYYNFFTFFDDIKHAERILENDKNALKEMALHSKFRVIRLCITSKDYPYSNKEMMKLATLLAKNGYKVEVY